MRRDLMLEAGGGDVSGCFCEEGGVVIKGNWEYLTFPRVSPCCQCAGTSSEAPEVELWADYDIKVQESSLPLFSHDREADEPNLASRRRGELSRFDWSTARVRRQWRCAPHVSLVLQLRL